jgi:hypothetical protein
MLVHGGDYVVHFTPGPNWVSLLLRAQAAGRIDSSQLWEILLAHADDAGEPDIAALLMHLPWPGEKPPSAAQRERPRAPSDDWFVVEGLGVA